MNPPPVNVNDSDHSEPARLSVSARSPGVALSGWQGSRDSNENKHSGRYINKSGQIWMNEGRNE